MWYIGCIWWVIRVEAPRNDITIRFSCISSSSRISNLCYSGKTRRNTRLAISIASPALYSAIIFKSTHMLSSNWYLFYISQIWRNICLSIIVIPPTHNGSVDSHGTHSGYSWNQWCYLVYTIKSRYLQYRIKREIRSWRIPMICSPTDELPIRFDSASFPIDYKNLHNIREACWYIILSKSIISSPTPHRSILSNDTFMVTCNTYSFLIIGHQILQ